jgi:hypothetical protein
MPLVKMRMLPEVGGRQDILVNTDAIQVVSPFGDRVILIVLGEGKVIHCEGTIDEFQALLAEAGGK